MTTETQKGSYNYRDIEKYWRQRWLEEKTFKTDVPRGSAVDGNTPPKCYVLDMFPYPSGDGLHIGHPKGYIASDIYSRFKRMQGFNVLHPMGFDSFGLPAEQYALEHNIHPAESTHQCMDHMRGQLQSLGLAYDWDREIATSDETYYRWTQWIFLQLFNSWFDPNAQWTDDAGRALQGRAVPIDRLCSAFESGQRSFSTADLEALCAFDDFPMKAGICWHNLQPKHREAVLNNYRLAYQKEVTVNWCPGLGTVLANEEVTNEGRSERGNFPVYKRPLKQWMLRITAYGDRLLADLDSTSLPDGHGSSFQLEWPEPIKLMQRNWIGRSKGAAVMFEILHPETGRSDHRVEVFTTRPDTLFGATFMVVAPEHPIVSDGNDVFLVPAEWPTDAKDAWKGGAENPTQAVAQYVTATCTAGVTTNAMDGREKTGVFTGIYARNPVNDSVIPVFVADYVSMEYGTGAIMAVPAHDDRDFEFAKKYDLDIIRVVEPSYELGVELEDCFTGEGRSINSPPLGESSYAINGLDTVIAIKRITEALEAAEAGYFSVSYRLRDWVFSRQRYWGEPFPLAIKRDGSIVTTEVPVVLPSMENFRPETSDDPDTPVSPPLGRAGDSWRRIQVDGVECERELNVMPQWAGSCWYFLRFIDPTNEQSFCDAEKERYFMPVDLYIGGAEHAVLHLLYARFWHKVLFDLGKVSSPEPFKKLFNQGMITADAFTDDRGVYVDIREVEFHNGEPFHTKNGAPLTRSTGKMGKRYKNGLPPEEIGEEYGVDTLRLYEMYMGPLEQSAPWSMEGIRGMQRFLQRLWRNLISQQRGPKSLPAGQQEDVELRKKLHKTINKVTADVENLRLNTAIASLIELNNEMVNKEAVSTEVARSMVLMLAPFAPHISEEIWCIWDFGDGDLSIQTWPLTQKDLIVEDTVTMPVQVNGKVRSSVDVPVGIGEDEVREIVLELDNVRRHIADTDTVKRFVYVPNKIINIVV